MEQLINLIIRPPRADYSPKHDLLDKKFMLKDQWFQRKDIKVTNDHGHVLQCCHYMPSNTPRGKALPCVIYCHGNSGCRADATEAALILLPSHITVFAFDFSGSGLSEGEFVTLGWKEKDDLKAITCYLRTDGGVSRIGLWGRSMGAVTSLMHAAEDPSIAGIVLDSPFSNLVDVMMELVDAYKVRLPKFTVKFAIQYMRKIIIRKADFDIMDLNVVQVAKSCFVPALIGHAINDVFIHPRHSDLIWDAYGGDKNIIKFEGDHNSPRPQFYFDSVAIFFHNVLDPPFDFCQGSYLQNTDSLLSKDTEDVLNSEDHAMGGTETSDISQMEAKEMKKVVGSSSSPMALDFSCNRSKNEECLEYMLNTFGDFPCSEEDESDMLMEAIIESLKDLDAGDLIDERQVASSETLGVGDCAHEINSTIAALTSKMQGDASLCITADCTSTNASMGLVHADQREAETSDCLSHGCLLDDEGKPRKESHASHLVGTLLDHQSSTISKTS